MPSPQTASVRQVWTDLLTALAPPAGIPEYRVAYDELCATFPVLEGTTIAAEELGGVPALRVRAASASGGATIIWAHSGGYVFGSAAGYQSFGAALSAASGADVVLVDYRRAPESTYPAAHDDVRDVFRALVAKGVSAGSIVLGGDSAGGGIAAGSLLSLKDDGDLLPAAIMLVSPFVDFTFSGASMTARADIDPIGTREMLEGLGGLYRNDQAAENPYLSPVLGNWAGAPPLLAMVGTDEVLYDDAHRLVARAQGAGCEATFVEGEGQAHIWTLFAHFLPEGQQAVDRLGSFVRQHARVGADL